MITLLSHDSNNKMIYNNIIKYNFDNETIYRHVLNITLLN